MKEKFEKELEYLNYSNLSKEKKKSLGNLFLKDFSNNKFDKSIGANEQTFWNDKHNANFCILFKLRHFTFMILV